MSEREWCSAMLRLNQGATIVSCTLPAGHDGWHAHRADIRWAPDVGIPPEQRGSHPKDKP